MAICQSTGAVLGKVATNIVHVQGFQLLCKVADILLKAPDVKAPHERRRRKHLGAFGGMLPQEIFKIKYSETPFPAFL